MEGPATIRGSHADGPEEAHTKVQAACCEGTRTLGLILGIFSDILPSASPPPMHRTVRPFCIMDRPRRMLIASFCPMLCANTV